MCIIIHREQGSNVPNDVLDYNRRKNPDGFGISWRDHNGVHSEKFSPKDYDPFHALLKKIDRQPDVEYVAHYRLATHGAPCKELSHPFVYEDSKVGPVHVFHNGIIHIDTNKDESDTSMFVKSVLAKMPAVWWRNPALVFLVEQAIGYSRLLLMTRDETIRLDGGSSWRKKGGIWYSTEPGPVAQTTTKSAWTPTGGQYASPATKGLYVPAQRAVVPVQKPVEVKSTDPRNFGFIDADDDEVQSWVHEGHRLESLQDKWIGKKGEDASCEVVCCECNTIGEVYFIDGETFIEVSHDPEDTEDDDEDLDALTMARVYAN